MLPERIISKRNIYEKGIRRHQCSARPVAGARALGTGCCIAFQHGRPQGGGTSMLLSVILHCGLSDAAFQILTQGNRVETLYREIHLHHHHINDAVIDSMLQSDFADLEDAIQYYSALAFGADIIVTRNTQDYVSARIPVLMPQEFIKQ